MVRLGSDLLLASSRLKGTRVGVVCNHASLDRGYVHIVDRLASTPDVTLAAIFGLIGMLSLLPYKITRAKHAVMTEQLAAKRASEASEAHSS